MIQKNYHVRIIPVFLLFLTIFLIITLRFYSIQIHKHHFFTQMGTQQYDMTHTMPALRGTIFDRDKKPLTINAQAPSAFILTKHMHHPKETRAFLEQYFPNVYAQLLKQPERAFFWVGRNLSKRDHEFILEHGTVDISLITESTRNYPAEFCSSIIGRVDIDNKGIEGIEYKFNNILAGMPQTVRIKKDARSKQYYFEKDLITSGAAGQDIQLSIDSTLQFFAYEEVAKTVTDYKAQSGAAIILNPDTGEILAMVNVSAESDDKTPGHIKNFCVTDCFEFGSVMKTFTALAAFEEKVVTPDEIIDCEGHAHNFGKLRVVNWTPLEKVPFSEVIRRSSNVGIAKIAARLDTKMFAHLEKLGFGKKTGIEFPGERGGFVPTPHRWSKFTRYVLSFGYEISATLLQLARAFSIIAHDGYDVTPTLLKQTAPPDTKEALYSHESISQLKNILEATAQRYAIDGVRVMGKTGTARIAEHGTYSTKRHVYTFGGIIEQGSFRRVIITFIREPEKTNLWAAEVAAPLFKRIAEKVTMLHKTTQKIYC